MFVHTPSLSPWWQLEHSVEMLAKLFLNSSWYQLYNLPLHLWDLFVALSCYRPETRVDDMINEPHCTSSGTSLTQVQSTFCICLWYVHSVQSGTTGKYYNYKCECMFKFCHGHTVQVTVLSTFSTMQRKHSSTSMKLLVVKSNMRSAECLLPFFSW